jgi:hypothetical protein
MVNFTLRLPLSVGKQCPVFILGSAGWALKFFYTRDLVEKKYPKSRNQALANEFKVSSLY